MLSYAAQRIMHRIRAKNVEWNVCVDTRFSQPILLNVGWSVNLKYNILASRCIRIPSAVLIENEAPNATVNLKKYLF